MALGICNHIELETRIPCFRRFAFVDTDEHHADDVFIRNEVFVLFSRKELRKIGSSYRVVFCWISKANYERFAKSMADLERKLLMSGYTDYSAFCRDSFGSFLSK